MYARDVMTSPVYIVSPTDTGAYARNLMVKHKISRVLVMENGKLIEMLTKKDIGYKLKQKSASWRRRSLDQIPVSAVASPTPIIVTPDTGIRKIASLMIEKNISRVPVVDAGTVTGIVTKSDHMKSAFVSSLDRAVQDVREDVATVTRQHSLDHVINVMSARNDKVVVTNDDGSIAGIITETNLAFFEEKEKPVKGEETDVTRQVRTRAEGTMAASVSASRVAVENVMTTPVHTIAPDQSVADAVTIMMKEHINSLVVIGNNTIAGIIKRDDIIKEVAK